MRPIWLLLLVPYAGLLWVPLYNKRLPDLFGFPFFYWYQLVPDWRRCLRRLYDDRGAGPRLCRGRLWLLRAALCDHRLSLRLRRHAGALDGREGTQPCDGGGRGAWPLCFAPARARGGLDRRSRDHALYCAAADRHGDDPSRAWAQRGNSSG